MNAKMMVAGQPISIGAAVNLRYGGSKAFWVRSFDPDGVTVHVLNEHDVDIPVPRADIVGRADR